MARMKRNDRLTFSTAGVLAAAAVAAIYFVAGGHVTAGQERPEERIAPAATDSATPEESPSPLATVEATPGGGAETAEPDVTRKGGSLDPVAVWPETTRESAALACEDAPTWRAQRQSTVGRFASEFLKRESPIINPTTNGNDFYAVSAGLDEAFTLVQVAEVGRRGCWSVTSVSAPDVADLVNYTMRNGKLEVVFDRHLSAVDIHVAWGASNVVGSTENADRVSADLGDKREPDEPGSWIAVLKGSDGEVLGAWGGTFPAGESAAG